MVAPSAERQVVVTARIACTPARSTLMTTTLFTTCRVAVNAGPLRWLKPPSFPAG